MGKYENMKYSEMNYKQFVEEMGITEYREYYARKFYPEFYNFTTPREEREEERAKEERIKWSQEYARKQEEERREKEINEHLLYLQIKIRERRNKRETWGCEYISNSTLGSIYEAYTEYREYNSYEEW